MSANIPLTEPEIETESEDIGELEIAEYVVFLLAVDTYIRYLSEFQGAGASDDLSKKALKLMRAADRMSGSAIETFLLENLEHQDQKNQLTRAFAYNLTLNGLAQRALRVRALLRRGGASLLNHLFKGNKPKQEVKNAMTAVVSAQAGEALGMLAKLPMTTNARLRKWIDDAAEFAGSNQFQNPVAAAVVEIAEVSPAIQKAKVTQDAKPGTEEAKQAVVEQERVLAKVQTTVTVTAAKALQSAGIPDKPATLSEVHGIVAATVAAVVSDPTDTKNLPRAFINKKGEPLDSEQIDAALTGGKVIIAAGAGAGKSTTLVSRIAYMVDNLHQDSSRILACCFNKKASTQLKAKIEEKVGANNVRCGTLHSVFAGLVVGDESTKGLGNDEERAMLRSPRLISPDKGSLRARTLSTAIIGMWTQCKDAIRSRYDWMPEEWEIDTPPKAKKATLFMNKWRGNGVTLEMAKEQVKSEAEGLGYIWYEMYLGIKGDIPGWEPPCSSKAYDKFMDNHRRGGERLGDMEDMQKVLLDILRRDPEKRELLQNAFDHILVDEAQDLNFVQREIFRFMSAKVTRTNGKSFWLIGDDKQCIYQFRGSKPEQFVADAHDPEFEVRYIRTNYRCDPEIVEIANRLAAHNKGNLKMECRAKPGKARGTASIVVETPPDSASAAIQTIRSIVEQNTKDGEPLSKFAVLSRTNAELNDFETACIINEVKYVKKSGAGFLDAPESKALLGYIDLAMGDSYESMRQSLAAAILYPDRGIRMKFDDAEKCVDEALRDVARRERIDKNLINPTVLLDRRNARLLADALKRSQKAAIIAGVAKKNKKPNAGQWVYDKIVDNIATNLEELGSDLRTIEQHVKDNPEQPTSELINTILDGVSSTVREWDATERREVSETKTLREHVSLMNALFSDEEEEDDDDDGDTRSDAEKAESIRVTEEGQVVEVDEDGVPLEKPKPVEGAGLGNIQFLFQLAIPNANDAEHGTNPATAEGFIAKIARYRALGEKLRIDPVKWEKEHGDEAPPAVTLSTAHKVKGAEWDNVTVMMPKGTFPIERKPKKGDPPPDPEEEERTLEAERNLAYVSITRAMHKLRILCPEVLASGQKGGISQFVFEAFGPSPTTVATPPGEPESKVASVAESFGYQDMDIDSSGSSYDWRAA